MLNKLRNFSKGRLAGVLVGIIIIPFVFWGMGSVFSGGNTNSIAKINNYNISTQDFTDFINDSKISPELIKENINSNVLEQLLTQFISASLIDLEIGELKISISDEVLANQIKKEKTFYDENGIFSRTKYEKFLLESNLSSVQFEQGIRENELKKKLFIYISGGIKSPFFLTNKTYKHELKKINLDYIDLNTVYLNKDTISKENIEKHLNENKENFLVEKIDISYIKITPENLAGVNEFNEDFFSKIDEIEDLISNNSNINQIATLFNLKINKVNEYFIGEGDNQILNDIYAKRKGKNIDLIDRNDFFVLYEIKNLNKTLPSLKEQSFFKKIKNDLYEKEKYKVHKNLLEKIQENKFTISDFEKLSRGKINNLSIDSINDVTKFSLESTQLLYALGVNDFSLISDDENNVYLTRIKNINKINLDKNSKNLKEFEKKTNIKIRDNIYNSYDFLLNDKYSIEINQNTLDRIKNYFR